MVGVGLLPGLTIGAILGGLSSRDTWQRVLPRRPASVALVPTPDGRLVLAATIAF